MELQGVVREAGQRGRREPGTGQRVRAAEAAWERSKIETAQREAGQCVRARSEQRGRQGLGLGRLRWGMRGNGGDVGFGGVAHGSGELRIRNGRLWGGLPCSHKGRGGL